MSAADDLADLAASVGATPDGLDIDEAADHSGYGVDDLATEAVDLLYNLGEFHQDVLSAIEDGRLVVTPDHVRFLQDAWSAVEFNCDWIQAEANKSKAAS